MDFRLFVRRNVAGMKSHAHLAEAPIHLELDVLMPAFLATGTDDGALPGRCNLGTDYRAS